MNDGKTYDAGYSTTDGDEDAVNYREIAEIMTDIGFPMNHSSARNHVVRAMKKFADAFIKHYNVGPRTDEQVEQIAKDPRFQSSIKEYLHYIEASGSSQT